MLGALAKPNSIFCVILLNLCKYVDFIVFFCYNMNELPGIIKMLKPDFGPRRYKKIHISFITKEDRI